MECTGEDFFHLQGRKTASLKFRLFDQIFSFLPKVVALICFNRYFQRKKTQNHPTCKWDQSQHGGFLEDFLAVRPET